MTTTVTVAASGRDHASDAAPGPRRAIADLAAAVAHEVNNPLTAVLGYAELLLAELPVDGHGRVELETIRDEAIRARAVVRALVDFARPPVLDLTPTDLNAVVRAALDADRDRRESAAIVVRTSYGNLRLLSLDAGAIGQAVRHLVANAIASTSDGGTVRITTEDRGNRVSLTIADDGPRVDDELRARLFEPFVATGRRAVGHGLGLATALAIVAAHGGSIDVASGVEQGTIVQVRLPLHRPPNALGPIPSPALR